MRTAVDTNVLSEVLHGTGRTAEATRLLTAAEGLGALVICPVVYAELIASPYLKTEQVQSFFTNTGISVASDLEMSVWEEAGLRFGKYSERRKRSGGGAGSRRLLADFVIGAHALKSAERLLTFDRKRYEVDFAELKLVAVEQPH